MTKQQAFRRHIKPPVPSSVRELSAQQKDRDSSFSLRPLLVSTTWLQTAKKKKKKKALEDAARITSYKHEPDQLKPFETRSVFF